MKACVDCRFYASEHFGMPKHACQHPDVIAYAEETADPVTGRLNKRVLNCKIQREVVGTYDHKYCRAAGNLWEPRA